jgi:hypothetical protein
MYSTENYTSSDNVKRRVITHVRYAIAHTTDLQLVRTTSLEVIERMLIEKSCMALLYVLLYGDTSLLQM